MECGKTKRAIMTEISGLTLYICKILYFPSFTPRARFSWLNCSHAGLSLLLVKHYTSPQVLVQAVWQVLCDGSQPCADVLCAWNGMSFLCSGTRIAKNVIDSHTHSLCQKGLIKTKKFTGLCFSAYFLYQQITSVVPWSVKGDGCIRDEHVKGSPSNCAQPRRSPNLSPVPSEEEEGHTIAAVGKPCQPIKHYTEFQEGRSTQQEMQQRYLVYLPGSEKRCCCWFQIKMCFCTPLLSGEFIVSIHHYWLAACPDIHCVCFRKLRFSTFPKFLTFKTIWSPMGYLDAIEHKYSSSAFHVILRGWATITKCNTMLAYIKKSQEDGAFLPNTYLLDFGIPQLQGDWVGMTNWKYSLL